MASYLFLFIFTLALSLIVSSKPSSEWAPCVGSQISTNSLLRAVLNSAPEFKWKLWCLNLTVPLNYDDPDGPQVIAFATKLAANITPARGQFWMLEGGPGSSGEALIPTMLRNDVMDLFGGEYDIVFPDHRGTGFSSPLYCPTPEVRYVKNCTDYLTATYGDDLLQFTCSNAARDLHQLILATDYQEIHMYGISYGTYWLQRYLQIYADPDERPNSAILDGICSPDRTQLISYDFNFNQIGHTLLERCDEDKFCAAAFDGISAYEALLALFAQVDSNKTTCFDSLSHPLPDIFADPHVGLEWLFAAWVESDTERVFIPPTIFRLLRCNSDDIAALNTLMAALVPEDTRFNCIVNDAVLSANVGLSEMFTFADTPPSAEELLKATLDLHFATFVPLRIWLNYWDTYPWDEYCRNFPNVDGLPLLLMNGNLDPATPVWWSAEVYSHYENSSLAHYVMIDMAPHGSLVYSPVQDGGPACGLQIVVDWVTGGYLNSDGPDTSCLNDLAPIDWEGTTNTTMTQSETFFGTTDMWQL